MKFSEYIELTCQNEEMANAVLMQIEPLKAHCITKKKYSGIGGDELEMQARVKGSTVCVVVARPDYKGLFDPDFFDGSFEAIAAFLEEKVPGAILSGHREYDNPDIYRSLQEYLSKTDGSFSTSCVVDVNWEEINELMENGADINEICSMLDMDEDEVWDGLSSLESGEGEDF